ncbi:Vps54-domain-containing protein [Suhomyces tanzawaensis NRRL Y-17324]|uniref:Vps54-domain-containing protein n=1 Tax=Suhomyces tanzawaensis NRRL Y-17324 TaxID=984487 RepID=A0A1E4SJM5_9ASCO|nr:Vps54-domain-containing protein [Suhomyces tanzawaensis NRRL Y-17324]ODV79704.1 Vps54-domain-containing protein [Suhomyces tanzawaensis NRRL Y-17324]
MSRESFLLHASDPSTSRPSFEGSVDLNDDLANGSEYSLGSYVSQSGAGFPKRSGSTSFRNSIDADSTFLSSAYFNVFNTSTIDDKSFSPLGPNSIYELTIASDLARINKNRGPKNSVTINGGATTVTNLRAPSIKDIPQIQLLKLAQKVNNKDLENDYVKNVIDDYRNFELSYKLLTEDTLQQFVKQAAVDSDGPSASSSIKNFGEDLSAEDLSIIPSIYADPDFRLDDPRVFKSVLENSSMLSVEFDDSTSQLTNNNDLQDKLSHYLDIVEINLIKEISKSSESFFSTLGDIELIKSQSKGCVDQFQSVLTKLEKLEQNHAATGLTILDNLVKRDNAERLESSLLQLQYIVSINDLANRSFNNGNYSKCLNEIVTVESLIQGIEHVEIVDEEIKASYPKFNFPSVNLTHLPALVHLRNDLENLKSECSKGYINDFINLLLEDLRDHYNSVDTQDTLNRMYVSTDKSRKYASKSINNSYLSISDFQKKNLSHYIRNLIKSGHLTQAYSAYQDRIINEIKNIIKHNLPTANSQGQDLSNAPSRSSSVPPESSNPQQPNTLSSNIKSLTPKEFESMLTKTYASLSECLRRLTAHQKTLLDLALTALPPSLSQTIDVMALDITTSIHKAIELTQIRLTKVINVRLEQTADLPVAYYLRLYAISSSYLQECELINPGFNSSGAGSSLSEWFKHHVTYFVHRFHLNSLRALVADCDREVWKELTLPESLSECQEIVDQLVGYSEFIANSGRSGFSGDSWLRVMDFYEDAQSTASDNTAVDSSITKVSIKEETFLVPELIRKSLKQVRDYIIISKVFPNTASLIENNLLNYFKLMNSKSSQAVLNAGATRTAGLKHITTKHLALCIQLVEFNIEFLGHIQNILPRAREEGSINHDELNFDRVISNYKDHENELFSKLVSIMYDRTTHHCATILKIDFSDPIKHPKQCHPYMETLVKDTLTVSKVLFRYLPDLKCSLILLQVFDNYKKLFIECFCTQLPQFKDFNEKHSLLKDIDYFRVKLSELPGYGNSGQVIWENVNALPTEEDMKMDEVMRNNIQAAATEANEKRLSELERVTSNSSPIVPQKDDVDEKPELPAKNEVPEVPEVPEKPEVVLPQSGVIQDVTKSTDQGEMEKETEVASENNVNKEVIEHDPELKRNSSEQSIEREGDVIPQSSDLAEDAKEQNQDSSVSKENEGETKSPDTAKQQPEQKSGESN